MEEAEAEVAGVMGGDVEGWAATREVVATKKHSWELVHVCSWMRGLPWLLVVSLYFCSKVGLQSMRCVAYLVSYLQGESC